MLFIFYNRCNGGFPGSAWEFWVDHGIVTGGLYNSGVGCQPYSIASCEHHVKGKLPPCTDIVKTPKCVSMCEKSYNVSYRADKHFGEYISYITEYLFTYTGKKNSAIATYSLDCGSRKNSSMSSL